MKTNRWSYESKFAYLSGEFGADYACRVFGISPAQLEEKVGRYVRGKRVGLLRGHITWFKVIAGGWVKTGSYDFDAMQGNGFVAPRGVKFGHGVFDSKGACVFGFDSSAQGSDVAAELRDSLHMMRAAPAATSTPRDDYVPERDLSGAEVRGDV